MSEVSERIALLSKERRALFQALLTSKGANAHTIPRCSRSDSMPMSYAQQRLWFIDQLDPGNPAYNCPVPVRLEGRLQVEALARSLNALVRRHEILRTTYGVRDGEPVQIVNEDRQVPLPVVDLTALRRPEQENAVR